MSLTATGSSFSISYFLQNYCRIVQSAAYLVKIFFGSGPYKLKEWKKGEYVLLEKNSWYSGEKPVINEIKFLFNSDINYLIGMLRKGILIF